MRFNENSEPYLDVLRENDIYPSFASIEELVLLHDPPARRFALFARPLIESALVALLAIAALWHMTPPTKPFPHGMGIRGPMISSVPDRLSASIPKAVRVSHRKTEDRQSGALQDKVRRMNSGTAVQNDPPAAAANAGNDRIPSDPQALTAEIIPSSLKSLVTETRSAAETKTWTAFLSGSPLVARSISFGASAGIEYRLNSASSLVFELRRNAFIVNRTGLVSSIVDTTTSLDGQTLHNAIGTVSPATTLSTSSVLSLDFGYRFDFSAERAFSPFVEVLMGGSVSRVLSSESIGVRYAVSSPLLFDLAARSDQLYAPRQSPERAFAVEAGLGFAW